MALSRLWSKFSKRGDETLSMQQTIRGPELNDELERFGDWRRRRRKS